MMNFENFIQVELRYEKKAAIDASQMDWLKERD
jgi:hypothetical protein